MDIPLLNWTAPQFFNLPKGIFTNLPAAGTAAGSSKPAGLNEKVSLDLMTFVPITPCRLVDTRGLFSPVYAGGAFAAGETRVYRASGNCGVPAGNNRVKAVSLAVTTPPTAASGDIEILSEAATLGGTVVMVIQAGQWNSATTVSAVDTQGDFKTQLRGTGGDVVIDINGYYGDTDPLNIADVFFVAGNYGGDGGMFSMYTHSATGAATRAQNAVSDVRLAQGSNAIDVASGGLRIRGAGYGSDTIVFVHDTTGVSCQNGSFQYTVLDHPSLNGNNTAIVLVHSPIFRYPGQTGFGTHDFHPVDVLFYNGNLPCGSSNLDQRWAIVRLNNAFPDNVHYPIMVVLP